MLHTTHVHVYMYCLLPAVSKMAAICVTSSSLLLSLLLLLLLLLVMDVLWPLGALFRSLMKSHL